MNPKGDPIVDRRPLVVVISHTPLLAEGLAASLDWLADVRPYPNGRPTARQFLEHAQPAGIVVEGDPDDPAISDYATAAGVPLVVVRLHEKELEVVTVDGIEVLENPEGSADLIADVLAGAIVGHRTAPND